jgi:ABC-type transporter MlaC component
MKLILTFVLLLILSVKVEAQESAEVPETLIKNIFTLAQKESALKNPKNKNEIDAQFDWRQMSLNILGSESKKRSAAELKWFEESIKEIITKTVYPKAPEFLQDVKITYRKTLIDDNKATVSSTVSRKGETTDVAYTLLKSGSSWKVIDVSLDEDSWVKTINEKITQSIKEKGWAGVKDLFNKRIKALNEKK